jgi:quercetin dioxygenase-like cupin family protein
MTTTDVPEVQVEQRLDEQSLMTIAAGIAATTLPWELRTGDVPIDRCYELVLVTPIYEVWIICWPQGGQLDLHDHGGSAGAFTVVSGALDELRVEDGELRSRTVDAGQAVTFPSDHVHAVANRSTAPATSVHVYSPPLGPMGFYERDGGGNLVAVAH